MSKYQPVDAVPPPKDGTWFLLRGRNSAGQPMIPVVASWAFGVSGGSEKTWRDSASLRNVSFLIIDVPPGVSADWASLPDDGWEQKEILAPAQKDATSKTKWGTPSRYWWIAVLKALEELGPDSHAIAILERVDRNNRRTSIKPESVKASATVALSNCVGQNYIERIKPYHTITDAGRSFLRKNLKVYQDFNK